MHALWNWLSHKSELFQVCLCLREWWAGPSHGMWQSKSVPKFSYEIFFTHKKNLEQGQGGPKRSNGQRRGSCYLFKTILPGGQPLWPHNVCAIGHYTSGDEDDGHQQPMRERSLWVCVCVWDWWSIFQDSRTHWGPYGNPFFPTQLRNEAKGIPKQNMHGQQRGLGKLYQQTVAIIKSA